MMTLSATQARREFFDIVKRATSGHRVYRIQHRKGTAVLMSEEDYDGLVETLELLSVPGLRESIQRSVKQIEQGDTVRLEKLLGEADCSAWRTPHR